MVDPETYVRNIGLLIGLLLFLGAAFIFLVSAWTTISSLIWISQRRRAEREHRAKEFRSDGKPYPPVAEGVCTQCGRGSRKVYFPPRSGKELCPICYDAYWRDKATWQAVPRPNRAQPNRARKEAALPRVHEKAAPPCRRLVPYPSRTM